MKFVLQLLKILSWYVAIAMLKAVKLPEKKQYQPSFCGICGT